MEAESVFPPPRGARTEHPSREADRRGRGASRDRRRCVPDSRGRSDSSESARCIGRSGDCAGVEQTLAPTRYKSTPSFVKSLCKKD